MSIMTESKHRFHFRALSSLARVLARLPASLSARLTNILTSGLSPQQLLLTCCIGFSVGTMPLVWGSSLLCVLLARRLQLNQLVLQSLNYLLYPLQLALLLPFCSLGMRLFPWGPVVPINGLTTLLHSQAENRLLLVLLLNLKALGAWLLAVPPLVGMVYLLFTTRQNCTDTP